uniref:Uncharacterized protein n=1 Tax=Arion vulgaris TaxID=1028688 RepID=A0A0B7AP94_9EUPU
MMRDVVNISLSAFTSQCFSDTQLRMGQPESHTVQGKSHWNLIQGLPIYEASAPTTILL